MLRAKVLLAAAFIYTFLMANYWDEELNVLSSENVNFAIGTAGLGSRFVAVFIDMVVQLLIYVGFLIVGLRYFEMLSSVYGHLGWSTYLTEAIFIFVSFLIFYAYFFLLEWLWHGMTIGKRLVGLRVIQANGLPATFWQILVRNVLRLIDFLPAIYGVGAIAVIFNAENRRLGDQAAGTIVVRERSEESASKILSIGDAVDAFLTSHHAFGNATPATKTAPAEKVALCLRLSNEDYEIARDFLLRRQTLHVAARTRIAALLARRIAISLNVSIPPEAQSESFLEYIVTQIAGK